MAVLCGMPTIQYSARRARLYMHKLCSSCIRRCLVSRACEWVMTALSDVLLIYSFQFRPAFLRRQSGVQRTHSGVLGLPNIGHRTSPKMWGGLFYAAYKLGEWFWINSTVKMETRHPVEESVGSEFPSISNQCWVMDAWSRKTLIFKKMRFFRKTTPYGEIFKSMFRKFSSPRR